MGYKTVKSAESQSDFRSNMSPPSSELKSRTSKKLAWSKHGAFKNEEYIDAEGILEANHLR
jgi:hypothetical protein